MISYLINGLETSCFKGYATVPLRIPLDTHSKIIRIFLKFINYRFPKDLHTLNPFLFSTGKWDLDHMSFCNLMQVSNTVSDIISMNPSSQINSIISFWDLGGLTSRHFLQCINPTTIKTMMQGLQVRIIHRKLTFLA